MAHQVRVNAGQTNVTLPDGLTYTGPITVLLTDLQFSVISSSLFPTVLTDLGGVSSTAELNTLIAQEIIDRGVGDTNEVTARIAAVTAEATLRSTGDTTEVTARTTAVTNEAATRAAADTAETNARTAADTAEATARANADATEATTRATADTTESSARAAADTAEATARTNADALLIPFSQRGVANGVATLDGSSLIPDAQIPPAIARDSETTAAVAAEATARSLAVSTEVTDRTAAVATRLPILNPTATKTAAYTAVAGDLVVCDTTTAAFTVTLPTAPSDKTCIGVVLAIQGSANIVTVAPGGTDLIRRSSTTLTLTLTGQRTTLIYQSSTGIWLVSDSFSLASIDARYVNDSTFTTKGDIVVATAASTLSRLAIGADAQVLTADSTQATGTRWSTPTTGGASGAASGDLTGTYPAPTLAATGPGATGPTGSATAVPTVSIDAKGRVTALTSTAILLAESSVTNLVADLAAKEAALVQTAVKASAYTAVAGDLVLCDSTTSGFTVTLPTSPADKTRIGVVLVTQVSTNAVTIAAGGANVFRKAGGPATLTLSLLNQRVTLAYSTSTGVWAVVDSFELVSLDSRFTRKNLAAAGYIAMAANPEMMAFGTIVRDANDAPISAPVDWDGTPGIYSASAVSTLVPGAVDSYSITYGSPVTQIYTQPAVTRNAGGAVTVRPAIVVSSSPPATLVLPGVIPRLADSTSLPGSGLMGSNEIDAHGAAGLRGIGLFLRWGKWEPTDGNFTGSIIAGEVPAGSGLAIGTTYDDVFRWQLWDAHNRNYTLLIRIQCGSDSPAWLWDPALIVGGVPVQTAVTVGNQTAAQVNVPLPSDAIYINRYNRMISHLTAILNEFIKIGGAGGTPTTTYGWQRVIAVPAAGPTEQGSEMTLGYGTASTTNATVQTLGTNYHRGDTTVTLAGSPASWPSDGTTQFLVRVGASWTGETGNKQTYAIPYLTETFRRTATSGLGYDRNGRAWTMSIPGAASASWVSCDGTRANFTFPTNPTTAFIIYGFHSTVMPAADCTASLRYEFDAIPTAGTLNVSLVVRATGSVLDDNNYRVGIQRNTVDSRMSIFKRVAGVETQLGATVVATVAQAANEVWMVRLEVVGTTIRAIQFKESAGPLITSGAIDYGGTNNSLQGLSVTDPDLTAAGKVGVRIAEAVNTTPAINVKIHSLIVGPAPTTARPHLLLVTRAAGTPTVLNIVLNDKGSYSGWSGTFGLEVASGQNVHWVDGGGIQSTPAIDTYTGPISPYAWNWSEWERAIPGEVSRRDAYRAGWADNIAAQHAILPARVTTALAGGQLFSDAYARAIQLAAWVGDGTTMGLVAGETGGNTYAGAVGGYGRTVTCHVTSVANTLDYTTPEKQIAFHRNAALHGAAVALGSAGASLADGDPLVQAVEDLISDMAAQTPTCRLVWLQTNISRFTTTTPLTTTSYKGYTGGAGKTAKQYLLSDAANAQQRINGAMA